MKRRVITLEEYLKRLQRKKKQGKKTGRNY